MQVLYFSRVLILMEIDMYIYLKIIKCVKLECIDVFLKRLKLHAKSNGTTYTWTGEHLKIYLFT